jgi:acetoin utilization deacetylase AcuC-like enzyme
MSIYYLLLYLSKGDGTARIFQEKKNIFTVSIHCEDNFPFQKAISSLDVGLRSGVQDREYLLILKDTLNRALELFSPDLLIYDAGVDISMHDSLGKLCISDDGILARDHFLLSECMSRNIPVAAVVGGGYDKDKSSLKLASRHALLMEAAVQVWDKSHSKNSALDSFKQTMKDF